MKSSKTALYALSLIVLFAVMLTGCAQKVSAPPQGGGGVNNSVGKVLAQEIRKNGQASAAAAQQIQRKVNEISTNVDGNTQLIQQNAEAIGRQQREINAIKTGTAVTGGHSHSPGGHCGTCATPTEPGLIETERGFKWFIYKTMEEVFKSTAASSNTTTTSFASHKRCCSWENEVRQYILGLRDRNGPRIPAGKAPGWMQANRAHEIFPLPDSSGYVRIWHQPEQQSYYHLKKKQLAVWPEA